MPWMSPRRNSFNTTWSNPSYPTRTWLSPLYRSTTTVSGARSNSIEISSTDYEVYGDIHLEAPNVILSRYQVWPLPDASARTRSK